MFYLSKGRKLISSAICGGTDKYEIFQYNGHQYYCFSSDRIFYVLKHMMANIASRATSFLNLEKSGMKNR